MEAAAQRELQREREERETEIATAVSKATVLQGQLSIAREDAAAMAMAHKAEIKEAEAMAAAAMAVQKERAMLALKASRQSLHQGIEISPGSGPQETCPVASIRSLPPVLLSGESEEASPHNYPGLLSPPPLGVYDVLSREEGRRGMDIYRYLDQDRGTGILDFGALGSLVSDLDRQEAMLTFLDQDGNKRVSPTEWLRYLAQAKETNGDRFGDFLEFIESHIEAQREANGQNTSSGYRVSCEGDLNIQSRGQIASRGVSLPAQEQPVASPSEASDLEDPWEEKGVFGTALSVLQESLRPIPRREGVYTPTPERIPFEEALLDGDVSPRAQAGRRGVRSDSRSEEEDEIEQNEEAIEESLLWWRHRHIKAACEWWRMKANCTKHIRESKSLAGLHDWMRKHGIAFHRWRSVSELRVKALRDAFIAYMHYRGRQTQATLAAWQRSKPHQQRHHSNRGYQFWRLKHLREFLSFWGACTLLRRQSRRRLDPQLLLLDQRLTLAALWKWHGATFPDTTEMDRNRLYRRRFWFMKKWHRMAVEASTERALCESSAQFHSHISICSSLKVWRKVFLQSIEAIRVSHFESQVVSQYDKKMLDGAWNEWRRYGDVMRWQLLSEAEAMSMRLRDSLGVWVRLVRIERRRRVNLVRKKRIMKRWRRGLLAWQRLEMSMFQALHHYRDFLLWKQRGSDFARWRIDAADRCVKSGADTLHRVQLNTLRQRHAVSHWRVAQKAGVESHQVMVRGLSHLYTRSIREAWIQWEIAQQSDHEAQTIKEEVIILARFWLQWLNCCRDRDAHRVRHRQMFLYGTLLSIERAFVFWKTVTMHTNAIQYHRSEEILKAVKAHAAFHKRGSFQRWFEYRQSRLHQWRALGGALGYILVYRRLRVFERWRCLARERRYRDGLLQRGGCNHLRVNFDGWKTVTKQITESRRARAESEAKAALAFWLAERAVESFRCWRIYSHDLIFDGRVHSHDSEHMASYRLRKAYRHLEDWKEYLAMRPACILWRRRGVARGIARWQEETRNRRIEAKGSRNMPAIWLYSQHREAEALSRWHQGSVRKESFWSMWKLALLGWSNLAYSKGIKSFRQEQKRQDKLQRQSLLCLLLAVERMRRYLLRWRLALHRDRAMAARDARIFRRMQHWPFRQWKDWGSAYKIRVSELDQIAEMPIQTHYRHATLLNWYVHWRCCTDDVRRDKEARHRGLISWLVRRVETAFNSWREVTATFLADSEERHEALEVSWNHWRCQYQEQVRKGKVAGIAIEKMQHWGPQQPVAQKRQAFVDRSHLLASPSHNALIVPRIPPPRSSHIAQTAWERLFGGTRTPLGEGREQYM